MKTQAFFVISFILSAFTAVFALEPDQILVITNSDIESSVQIGHYYCEKRNVPTANILSLPLGKNLNDAISRGDYEKLLAEPIRQRLSEPNFSGKIECLLLTYGVPFKVGGRERLENHESQLSELEKQVEQEKQTVALLENIGSASQKESHKLRLAQLQSQIDCINGKETNASVDSELSMVLFENYELYRWQPNNLKRTAPFWDYQTLMVSRLDGPGRTIAIGLIDKALAAEKTGLKGIAYIDSRGIPDDKKPNSYGSFDQYLRNLAVILKSRAVMPVREETTEKLFGPGECPRTAIYCGWYSLKKYIDSFDFVPGAIGYHIASFEAVDLRDPNSTEWCPAMLKHGITATVRIFQKWNNQ